MEEVEEEEPLLVEEDEDESFSENARRRPRDEEEEEEPAPRANVHIQQSQLFQPLVLPVNRNPDEIRPTYQISIGIPLYQQLADITLKYARATQGIKTPALFDAERQQMTQVPTVYDF
jgi:hypothetical protein